jgi:hypothetical protein
MKNQADGGFFIATLYRYTLPDTVVACSAAALMKLPEAFFIVSQAAGCD